MKAHIKRLLDDLDNIAELHSEIEDTDVREQLADAIEIGFIKNTPSYNPPDSFGMFSPEADAAVKVAVSRFLAETKNTAAPSECERLRQFQDPGIESRLGNKYDDYFGHREAEGDQSPTPKAWWQFWKP